MSHMTMTWRRILLASGIVAVLGLTACSAGSSPPASRGGPAAPGRRHAHPRHARLSRQ